jgi:surface antigen
MNKVALVILGGTLSVSLFGCNTMSKQDAGVLTGSAVGAVIGSQVGHGSGSIAAAAVGAVAGALIGGQIGNYMDQQDRMQFQKTLETSPTHRATSWKNPDTGNTYTITPTRTYKVYNRYCREYTTKAIINGQEQTVYGKACRKPDGSWKAVS